MLSPRFLRIAARALPAHTSVTLKHAMRAWTASAQSMSMLTSSKPAAAALPSTHTTLASVFDTTSDEDEHAAPPMESNVDDFDLSKPVVSALKAAGFTTLFPVQAETLPTVLAGRDVVVRARTGTGTFPHAVYIDLCCSCRVHCSYFSAWPWCFIKFCSGRSTAEHAARLHAVVAFATSFSPAYIM